MDTVSVRKPEGMRPLGRTRNKCEDSGKMELEKAWCEDVDWIQPGQDRLLWWW